MIFSEPTAGIGEKRYTNKKIPLFSSGVSHLYQIIDTSSNKNAFVKNFIKIITRSGKTKADELVAILITCDYDDIRSS
jgi:hypothetical protein